MTGASVTVTTGAAAGGAVVQLGAAAAATVSCSAALTLSYTTGAGTFASAPSTATFSVRGGAAAPAGHLPSQRPSPAAPQPLPWAQAGARGSARQQAGWVASKAITR